MKNLPIAEKLASKTFGDGARYTVLLPSGEILRSRTQDGAESAICDLGPVSYHDNYIAAGEGLAWPQR